MTNEKDPFSIDRWLPDKNGNVTNELHFTIDVDGYVSVQSIDGMRIIGMLHPRCVIPKEVCTFLSVTDFLAYLETVEYRI